MPPLNLWSKRTICADRSRVVLRVAPEHDALEPVVMRWIEAGIEQQPEFRRSRHSVVYRVDGDDLGTPIFLKQFLLRDVWDRIKRMVRPPRARSALLASLEIQAQGFATEPVIALAEYRRYGLTWKSLLVTQEIPNVHEARSVFRDPEHGLRADTPRRRALLIRLGREIGRWHKAGLHHGDLRLSNVLMQIHEDDCIFYWMDNERTTRHRELSHRLRIHNLMQVVMDPGVFSRTDAMRLWKVYKDASSFAPQDEKQFLREVIGWTQKRWRERGWM